MICSLVLTGPSRSVVKVEKKQEEGDEEELASCQTSQKPNPETNSIGNSSKRGETGPGKGRVRCIESF